LLEADFSTVGAELEKFDVGIKAAVDDVHHAAPAETASRTKPANAVAAMNAAAIARGSVMCAS
jgi:hypothetical protein